MRTIIAQLRFGVMAALPEEGLIKKRKKQFTKQFVTYFRDKKCNFALFVKTIVFMFNLNFKKMTKQNFFWRKVVVLTICLVGLLSSINAQPRAIGGRLSWGAEASYQHGLGKNMLQIDVGLPGFYGIQGVVTYDWIFPISSWQKAGSWNWYAGVGGGAGVNGWDKHSHVFVGIAGMIGVEYNFKFPLQLSLDYRPLIGPSFSDKKSHFYTNGVLYGSFGLGVRYNFNNGK